MSRLESNTKDEAEPVVTDFLEEFKNALFKQLIDDHHRWGNTWLTRSKKGQELRTLARYTDYFDMFKQTGEPVNWLAVTGGALICWIRENHPELCIDADECEDVGKPKIPTKAVIQEAHALELHNLVVEKLKDLTPDKVKSVLVQIKSIIRKDEVEDVCPVSGESNCAACAWENDCDKMEFQYNFDRKFAAGHAWRAGNVPVVEDACTCPDTDAIIKALGHAGPCEEDIKHKPGCASYNDPPVGFASSVTDCDCQEPEKPVEDMTTKELVERPKPPENQTYAYDNRAGDRISSEQETTDKAIVEAIKSSPRPNPVAHVKHEKLSWKKGILAYRPTTASPGRIRRDSVVFTTFLFGKEVVLAKCGKAGIIYRVTADWWIEGTLDNNGKYVILEHSGFDPGVDGTLYVSYEYEYHLPV